MQQSALTVHTAFAQNRTNRKSMLLRAGLLALFLTLITHPELTAQCAAKGLTTWYTSIVPTLLPSMILAGILIRTKACELLHPILAPVFQWLFALPAAGAEAFLVGILCGYPSGTMVTGELYREGRLSAEEAERLLLFCNYPSPMFLIGVVLHTALEDAVPVAAVLLPVYLGGILTGVIIRFRIRKKKARDNYSSPSTFDSLSSNIKTVPQINHTAACSNNSHPPIPSTNILPMSPNTPADHFHVTSSQTQTINGSLNHLLERSLMTAARTILIVGLYMMLFQIFSGLAIECLHLPPFLLTVLTGTLEMTNGTLLAAALPLSLNGRLALILGIASFGGLSTWLQVLTVLGEEAHLAKVYLKGRVLHCVLTVGICLVI